VFGSLYSFVVFVHVITVMVAFGAAAIGHLALLNMRRSDTLGKLTLWAQGTAGSAKLLPIASLIVLGTGLYLTSAAWGWGTGWIEVSIAGLLLIKVIGGAMIGPRMKGLGIALAQAGDGPVPPSIQAKVADPVLWAATHTNTAMVVGITILMTGKPAFPVAIAVLIAAAALGVVSAVPFWQRRAVPAASTADAGAMAGAAA
jgi:hypothetical protein